MISVLLRQLLLHGASRVKAKRHSVLAEFCLGFLLFPSPECRGFFSSSKQADHLEEASSVQMVPGFIFRRLNFWGVKVTTLFHLNQSLRTSEAMPLLSTRLHDVNRHIFPSNLILRQNYFLSDSCLLNIHNFSSLPTLAYGLLRTSSSSCEQ